MSIEQDRHILYVDGKKYKRVPLRLLLALALPAIGATLPWERVAM